MKMYTYYESSCQANGSKPVIKPIHMEIFASEYNLAFHRPTKYQCDVCTAYKMHPLITKRIISV